MPKRKSYPSDATSDECEFCGPYLTLMTTDAPQREYPLREVSDALRWLVRSGAPLALLDRRLPAVAGSVPAGTALDQSRLL